MSLSEISDNGIAHPWANFRINNLSVDGSITFTGDNQTALTDYEEYSAPVIFSGPIANTTVTIRLIRVGKMVSLSIPVISGAGNSTQNYLDSPAGAIPTRFLPSTDFLASCRIIDPDGSSKMSLFRIFTSGVGAVGLIRVYGNGDSLTEFTGGNGNGGLSVGASVSWSI